MQKLFLSQETISKIQIKLNLCSGYGPTRQLNFFLHVIATVSHMTPYNYELPRYAAALPLTSI